MKPWTVFLFLVVACVVIALLAVAVTLPSNYEVIAKGQILDYTNGTIFQLRLYDRFDLYLEPELRPNRDFINGGLLAAIGFISLTFAVCLHKFGVRDYRSGRNFFALAGIGSLYLAADELLGIHESIGHNMPIFARLPGIHRPDDFVIVLYGLAAGLFLLFYRKLLWRYRAAVRWFIAAVILIGCAVVADAVQFRYEEYLELLGSLCMIVGIVDLGLMTMRDQIQHHREAATASSGQLP